MIKQGFEPKFPMFQNKGLTGAATSLEGKQPTDTSLSSFWGQQMLKRSTSVTGAGSNQITHFLKLRFQCRARVASNTDLIIVCYQR